MSRSILRSLLVAALAAPLAFGACKRSSETESPAAAPGGAGAQVEAAPPAAAPAPAAFRVTGVELGSAVGPDKRISAPSESFGPGDSFHVSVASEGSAQGVQLTARWTYEDGQVIDETTQTLTGEGPAASEFHLENDAGWPAGRYQVEVLADGRPVGARQFEVR